MKVSSGSQDTKVHKPTFTRETQVNAFVENPVLISVMDNLMMSVIVILVPLAETNAR